MTLFLLAIWGLFIGSFLNCVIYRTENQKSFFRGRSFCPKCKHTLSWRDLIPIASFFCLKGKCRYCQEKISWQYPLVELACFLLFVLSPILRPRDLTTTIFECIVFSFLLIIFVYDLKSYIIPDRFVYPAIVFVALFRLFDFNLTFFLAGIGASFFFFLIWFFSQGRAMGFGDVKLAFLLGIFLGWPGIIVGLFIAFLVGALVGSVLIALKKKKPKSQVPFGPFLVLGALTSLFFGTKLLDFYLSLFL